MEEAYELNIKTVRKSYLSSAIQKLCQKSRTTISQVVCNVSLLTSGRQGQNNAWQHRMGQDDQQPKTVSGHYDEQHVFMVIIISDRKELDTSGLAHEIVEVFHKLMPLLEKITGESTKIRNKWAEENRGKTSKSWKKNNYKTRKS